MAFTRFHDDPNRIKKQLAESSFPGRYQLNCPGPGLDLPFFEDPQIRLQRWGANLRTDTINLESDLRGLSRPLNRDLPHINNHNNHENSAITFRNQYRNESPFIEESRATHPAWLYKDLEQSRWEHPWINPQHGLEKPFHDNIQTRILEKDYFTATIPEVNGINANYYLTGKSICIGNNC